MEVNHSMGFLMAFPDEWKVIQDPGEEVALVGVAPPDESGFSRNVVVTVNLSGDVRGHMDAWHEVTLEALTSALHDAQLIDKVVTDDSFRRLISYFDELRALTLEQWFWLWRVADDVYAVSISATTPTLQYGQCVDEMTSIAWSWAPTTGEQL